MGDSMLSALRVGVTGLVLTALTMTAAPRAGAAPGNGAGCGGAAGDVPFLPFAGSVAGSPAGDGTPYFASFDHANESASPGYYRVRTDDGITSELTRTQRSGGAGSATRQAGRPRCWSTWPRRRWVATTQG
jgi:hypothetical protein